MYNDQTSTKGDVEEMKSQIEYRADELRPAIGEAQSFEEIFGELAEEGSGKLDYFEKVDTAVVFFTIASELLDQYAEELFVQRILDDDLIEDEDVNEQIIVHSLSDKKIYEILRHLDIIEKKRKKEIKRVKDFRNRLVHNPEGVFLEADIDTLSSRFETANSLIEDLDQRI